MNSSWELRDVQAGTVERLAASLGVRPATARCLAARGLVEPAAVDAFLAPRLARLRSPAGLPDIDRAVDRLLRAARAGERVGVFGDYDVDGVTTCALLTSFLRAVGLPCVPRVARRDAGYGFGTADVAAFAKLGCSLVVVGDCGTSDIEPIAHARALGIDVLVVDHHTVPDAAKAHPATALVNPFRADSAFPFTGLASVGLSFYLVAALRTALRADGHFRRDRPEPDIRELLDLVAVGTIADLVPLTDENRILAHAGLRELARRQRPGLAALLDGAGVSAGSGIDEATVGWKLGPRLNAPGRLGDATPALELLLARSRAEADQRASALEQANDRRRELQATVLEQALDQLGGAEPGAAVVVAGEGWPSGVVGIVAAKLVERYRRPAFVIAVDPDSGLGRGSARGVPGINLYDALHACRASLSRYGGHAAAAGLSVERAHISGLAPALCRAVADQGDGADAAVREPARLVDAEVALAEVDDQLVTELDALRPFGMQNDAPVLVCRALRVVDSRRVGDGSHLKLQVAADDGTVRGGIAFGQGDDDPGVGARVDLAFQPGHNEWQGVRRVELGVRWLQVHQTGGAD